MTVKSQKRKGPPPTGKGTPLMVRLQPDALADLDAWIAAKPEQRLSRPEAVRRLLQEALAAKGPLTAADPETAIADRIEVLEAKVASMPVHGEPSPETGMNTMKRALAEAELIGLRQKRTRVRKASHRRDPEGAA